jgi:Fic family protein
MRTQLVKSTYLDYYKKRQPITISRHFNKIKEQTFNNEPFGYSASMASVYSSMIEGNNIDFDTYLKYSTSGMNTKSKSFREIEDLISAYEFARRSELNHSNFMKTHAVLTKNIISDAKYRGKIRDREVFIYGGGEKIYTGASVSIVVEETKKLFSDISILRKRELTTSEVFYFASMIHLVFVKIHPFADGNGRSARLLEKWFLAKKLGTKAWFIPSEKLYQIRIKSYYKNLNIGNNYTNVNYDSSIPFLLMLPMSLTIKTQ